LLDLFLPEDNNPAFLLRDPPNPFPNPLAAPNQLLPAHPKEKTLLTFLPAEPPVRPSEPEFIALGSEDGGDYKGVRNRLVLDVPVDIRGGLYEGVG
jgi:hypothetical protein